MNMNRIDRNEHRRMDNGELYKEEEEVSSIDIFFHIRFGTYKASIYLGYLVLFHVCIRIKMNNYIYVKNIMIQFINI